MISLPSSPTSQWNSKASQSISYLSTFLHLPVMCVTKLSLGSPGISWQWRTLNLQHLCLWGFSFSGWQNLLSWEESGWLGKRKSPPKRWDQRMISLALPFCCQLACTAVPLAEPAPGVAAVGQPLPPIEDACLWILSQGVDVTQVLPGTDLHWSFVWAKVMCFLKIIYF